MPTRSQQPDVQQSELSSAPAAGTTVHPTECAHAKETLPLDRLTASRPDHGVRGRGGTSPESSVSRAPLQDRTSVSASNVTIEPSRSLFRLDLRSLLEYRELLYFMVWRDVKVRYKQTLIGAGWVVVQPLVSVLIFSVIFGNFARMPSDGLPYPVFAFAALLPWTYFSQALARSGLSLVGHANLITKVYFPRLIIPFAATLAPAVDFAVAFVVLLVLMAAYGIGPGLAVLALPLFLLMALLTALAVSLWLGPLNVRYRDVGNALPFLSQIWMYASPVVYPVSIVPEKWRPLYSLNPMVGVIEGFRWGLLGKDRPDLAVMGVSAAAVLILFVAGLVWFRYMERSFADVV